MPDHVHVLIGWHPLQSLSDLARDLKTASSNFISDHRWVRGQFNWQAGFGAFSYAHSEYKNVARYIENQQEHHRKTTFKEEYFKILDTFAVDYKSEFLFEWMEDYNYSDI